MRRGQRRDLIDRIDQIRPGEIDPHQRQRDPPPIDGQLQRLLATVGVRLDGIQQHALDRLRCIGQHPMLDGVLAIQMRRRKHLPARPVGRLQTVSSPKSTIVPGHGIKDGLKGQFGHG